MVNQQLLQSAFSDEGTRRTMGGRKSASDNAVGSVWLGSSITLISIRRLDFNNKYRFALRETSSLRLGLKPQVCSGWKRSTENFLYPTTVENTSDLRFANLQGVCLSPHLSSTCSHEQKFVDHGVTNFRDLLSTFSAQKLLRASDCLTSKLFKKRRAH